MSVVHEYFHYLSLTNFLTRSVITTDFACQTVYV